MFFSRLIFHSQLIRLHSHVFDFTQFEFIYEICNILAPQ
jgi:hypothetical protein